MDFFSGQIVGFLELKRITANCCNRSRQWTASAAAAAAASGEVCGFSCREEHCFRS